MKEKPASSKPSEASVTSLIARLRSDLFSRTEFIIIGSLVILCAVNIVMVGLASHLSNLRSVEAAKRSVSQILSEGVLVVNPAVVNEVLLEEMAHIRTTMIIAIGSISIVFTLIMGYIVAKVALAPTRNALSAQKQFIANIAHEIRTPLSIVRANNEILRIESANDPEVEQVTTSTIEELDRISRIINNLLTLNAFLEREKLEFERVNVSDILLHSIDKLSRLTESKHQTVVKNITKNLMVRGDATALEQIAINLIKNASIYTPENGKITVSGSTGSNDHIYIIIADTGIGIEKEKLHHIFEPFYQTDSARTNKASESRGLGLAIVSELVRMHKGSITVTSTPNVGTVIQVTLPTSDHSTETNPSKRPSGRVHLDFSKKLT